MTELMQASHQWATRPDDERFASLTDMLAHFTLQRDQSKELVLSSRRVHVEPEQDNRGLSVIVDNVGRVGAGGDHYVATNWSFGQLAQLAEAPAGYLRELGNKGAAPVAADCLNVGLLTRKIEDIGVLCQNNGEHVLRAATGPRYGRIWNSDIVATLVRQFGNGVGDSDWRVPGEFGQAVAITKANTTLFASDRDLFVFLCDEKNRIDIPGRRGGKGMARGFFMWNSEVGAKTFGLGTFLFDYVCCNRIVWGSQQYSEITIRHTASAPDKWIEELQPALITYQNSATTGIVDAIKTAQAAKIDTDVSDFLANRFGKRMVGPMQAVHMLEENRPIETVFDAVTAATAYAKSVKWQDQRVELERAAGELLKVAA